MLWPSPRLAQVSAEWGRALGDTLIGLDLSPHATPVEHFEAIWSRVIDAFAEYRPLWSATFDVIGQIGHQPQVREHLAMGLAEAREGLVRMFAGPDDLDDDTVREIGNFYQAVLTGVMAQDLIDPQNAPTARQLARALLRITGT